MLPYKNLISINRKSKQAIYLQIVETLMQLIQEGQLAAATKLPGSRVLGALLGVHRNTITVAYEELEAQGWVEVIPKKGVFVHSKIPLVKGQKLGKEVEETNKIGYKLRPVSFIEPASGMPSNRLELNDGVPDLRLAPLVELGRAYRSVLTRINSRKELTYGSTYGHPALRMELLNYLQQTRGIAMDLENILISRGSIMGIYMIARVLLRPGDTVAVGRLNYNTANMMFRHLGAKLAYLSIDDDGIAVEELEVLCKKQQIRAVYVASHHHHPTTVTLSADRRLKLLALAKEYNFAIIEDDYDYDYHYQRNPILPLASIDHLQNVIYIGSLSKVIAPAFRVGFVVAHPDLIKQMGILRRIIDRQGDFPLEKAIAELFQTGEIQRHIRKSLKIYEQRRDCLSELLITYMNDIIEFEKPNGGLALWALFDQQVDLNKTADNALQNDLYICAAYTTNMPEIQGTRMGFASMNLDELEEAILILKKSIITKRSIGAI